MTGGDVFEIDGELLVRDPVEGTRFHKERNDFSRILYVSPGDYWEVTLKDGTRLKYGSRGATNSKLGNGPSGGGSTFRWSLDEVMDARGNAYRIDYEPTTYSIDGQTYWSNIRPARVHYSYYTGDIPATPGPKQDTREVLFDWDERGEQGVYGLSGTLAALDNNFDHPTSYRSGFKIQIRKRLAGIRAYVDGQLVSRYSLQYSPKASAADPAAPPFSQLAEIQRYASEDASQPFPTSTTFEYSRPGRGFLPSEQWSGPLGDYLSPNFDPVGLECEAQSDTPMGGPIESEGRSFFDVTGDGIPDKVGRTGGYDYEWIYSDPPPASPCSGIEEFYEDPVGCGVPYEPVQTVVSRGFGAPKEEHGWNAFAPFEVFDVPMTSEFVDFDGDGLVDTLNDFESTTSGWTWCRNTGLDFSSCQNVSSPGAPGTGATKINYSEITNQPTAVLLPYWVRTYTLLADVNGDGRPDHLSGTSVPDENSLWVSINSGAGFDAPQLWTKGNEPLDFVRAVHGFDPLRNAVTRTYSGRWDSYQVNGFYYPTGPTSSYTDSAIFDVNGDGIADHVPGQLCALGSTINFGLGSGFQYPGAAGHLRQSPDEAGCARPTTSTTYYQTDAAPQGTPDLAHLGTRGWMMDVNGDGVVDRVRGGGVLLGLGDGRYLAETLDCNSGSCAIGEFDWPDIEQRTAGLGYCFLQPVPSYEYVRQDIVDVNGDGLVDRVESVPTGNTINGMPEFENYWNVHLNPGAEGLLTAVNNEIGGRVELDYIHSTHFSVEEADLQSATYVPESFPASVVRTRLPTWLVSERRVLDGRTSTIQQESFSYAESRYDNTTRENLGMRMAERSVLEPSGGRVIRRTIFHQRHPLSSRREAREAVLETASETEALSLTTWSWTESVAKALRSDGGDHSVPGSWMVVATERSTTTFADDENGQPAAIQKGTQYEFDPLTGNLLLRRNYGADQTPNTGDELALERFYNPNVEKWILSLPFAEQWHEGPEAGQGKWYTYDGWTGWPWGAAPTRGLKTGQVASLDEGLLQVEAFAYDAFGNQTAYFGPNHDPADGIPTMESTIDSEFRSFVVAQQNSLAHASQYENDTRFGVITKALDANGYLRCWQLDGFGRLQSKSEAQQSAAIGDGCDLLTTEFSFEQLGNATSQRLVESMYPTSTALPVRTITYFDGLGRNFHTATERRTSLGDDFLHTNRSWDSRGRAVCEGGPFVGPPAATIDCPSSLPRDETQYDGRGRITRTWLQAGAEVVNDQHRSYWLEDMDGVGGGEQVQELREIAVPGLDRVRRFGRDSAGRIVAVEEEGDTETPTALTILFRDPRGRVVEVDGPDVQGNANRMFVEYNLAGLRKSVQPPGTNNAPWSYEYHPSGTLAKETSPRGLSVAYHYDELDRLVVKDFEPLSTEGLAGPEDTVLGYDAGVNGVGQLAFVDMPDQALVGRVHSAGVDTTYDYSLRGYVEWITRDFGGGLEFVSGQGRDALSRPTLAIYPDGRWGAREYDGNHLVQVVHSEPWAVNLETIAEIQEHDTFDGDVPERVDLNS